MANRSSLRGALYIRLSTRSFARKQDQRMSVPVGGGVGRPMSLRQLDKTGMCFTAAAPGTDGIRSTRLRGQGQCAVPEGHGTPGAAASHRGLRLTTAATAHMLRRYCPPTSYN